MLAVVIAGVADPLKTFRDVDARKANQRDDATHDFTALVNHRENSHDESHHLCLHHSSIIVVCLVFICVVLQELVVIVATLDWTCHRSNALRIRWNRKE
mgnify:CR=1 FL=1